MRVDKLPATLGAILDEAARLCGELSSRQEGNGSISSLETLLRDALAGETHRSRKASIHLVLQKLLHHHVTSTVFPGEGDTLLHLTRHPLNGSLLMTLFPPRSQGRQVHLPDILKDVMKASPGEELDIALVEKAYKLVHLKDESVWRLAVTPPRWNTGPARTPGIRWHRGFLDKGLFKGEWPAEGLLTRLESLRPGDVLAGGLESSVLPFMLGDGLKLHGGSLVAERGGFAVLEEGELDVRPFHVIQGDVGPGDTVESPYDVVVRGKVLPGARIEGRDVIIEGSVESSRIRSLGDTLIQGVVSGRKEGLIQCDGRFQARSATDITILSGADMTLRETAMNCQLVSDGHIRLTGPRGQAVGGTLQSFLGVEATILGNDFGTRTQVQTGRRFLSLRIHKDLLADAARHQDVLDKVKPLKDKYKNADMGSLPSEVQDRLMMVLTREKESRDALDRLEIQLLRHGGAEAVEMPSEVRTRVLHPSVEVSICGVVYDFKEKRERVCVHLTPLKTLDVKPFEPKETP
ncbi:MAG: FapA family protein [Planctomycetota bacterium]